MKSEKSTLTSFALLLIIISTISISFKPLILTSGNSSSPIFQKGMSYVSWPPNFGSSDSNESLYLLSLTHTEWVAVCIFWYQNNLSSMKIHTYYNTPSNSSVVKVVDRVHRLGMKVMLKPMVDSLNGSWRGEIPPSDAWFQSYMDFINFWAEFSQENKVDMLCIGCEFNKNDEHNENWENITAEVRERYSGPITYAANWDHYQNVNWWNAVDYIGIDAYFPLMNKNNPTVEELKKGWSSWANAMESWQATVNKPIIFTEIGYRSTDGANKSPWNYSASSILDLQEQVDCYDATFQTFYSKSWFYGFYWWNWETYPDAGGNSDTGYTPQNKPVQNLITTWYEGSTIVWWIWVTIVVVIVVMFIILTYMLTRKK